MLKMMIHMRRYAWMLAAVVVLLAAQAACELWLPTYTAAIVDVGIQQEGVESPVPEAVRESALEGMLAGMDAETAARVRAAYAPADEAALSRLGVTERADTVLVLREDAAAGNLAPTSSSSTVLYNRQRALKKSNDPGVRFELGLIDVKYALNAAAQGKAGGACRDENQIETPAL